VIIGYQRCGGELGTGRNELSATLRGGSRGDGVTGETLDWGLRVPFSQAADRHVYTQRIRAHQDGWSGTEEAQAERLALQDTWSAVSGGGAACRGPTPERAGGFMDSFMQCARARGGFQLGRRWTKSLAARFRRDDRSIGLAAMARGNRRG